MYNFVSSFRNGAEPEEECILQCVLSTSRKERNSTTSHRRAAASSRYRVPRMALPHRRPSTNFLMILAGAAAMGCASKPGVPLEMRLWDGDFLPQRVVGNVHF